MGLSFETKRGKDSKGQVKCVDRLTSNPSFENAHMQKSAYSLSSVFVCENDVCLICIGGL